MSALRPGLLQQDGARPASVYDPYQHVQRATVHAEGYRECRGLLCVALQLRLFDAAAAPPDLTHQEAAGRLVDVHDAVCADSVLVHEPAQLDEEPLRFGAQLLWAVELFHALSELLVPQAHAMQEPLHPTFAGTDVEPICVELVVRQASDRHRAEAQDVGHPQDVLAQPCHVCG